MFTKKRILAFFIITLFGLLIYIFINSNQYDSGSSFGIDDIKNENQSFTNTSGGNPILKEKITYINNIVYLIVFGIFDLIISIFFL
ncbi:hypothetical protein B0I03_101404 [Flavobacterium aquaticum]|uniref:Uncharacterized protein n=1 Tax=Flavobacterium aquaticum TaxID=1236486 RepID=A0A327YXB6_9FLAO|nr:hypothetical protein B0I03_101404 [Flavobacterium aquaticum]